MDNDKITYFAETDYRNERTPFGIKASDRTRHVYVIGKTGMGKSTMLENMAIQDIQNGNGLAFVDPHGKTAELLLDYVPENRIKDVLYFAPFDMDYPVAFNIMEDVGPDKRHLVVNGLMSTFEKIWVDAWSARMAYILSNTLLALLEFPGSTLLGINRMLSDKDYRKLVIANVKDPSVRAFWVDEFSKYTDRYAQEATPAIQNKVGQFTSNPLIRNIIGQAKSTFDLRKMMDENKILIVNLSKGRVGEGNANLIGSMIITKIYLASMSRADASENELSKLPNFYLYVDEFQSFANKSFADILSEARKYKLNLTIAHQYIEQMEEEVQAAVFGNVGSMITFRVGAFDAEVLEKEFAPEFTAEDLVNLGNYQIYLKLMINGVSSSPFSAVTLPPIQKAVMNWKNDVITASRQSFGRPRDIVEAEIKLWHEPIKVEVSLDKKESKKSVNQAEINSSVVKSSDSKPSFGKSFGNKESPVLNVAQIQTSARKNFPDKELSKENEFARAFKAAGVVLPSKDAWPARSFPSSKGDGRLGERNNNNNNNNFSANKPIDNKAKEVFNSEQSNQEQTVSLQSLKRGFPDKDIHREGNMSALKEALSKVLKNTPENNQSKNVSVKTSSISKMETKIVDSSANNNQKKNFQTKKIEEPYNQKNNQEISPEILKAILSDNDDFPTKS